MYSLMSLFITAGLRRIIVPFKGNAAFKRRILHVTDDLNETVNNSRLLRGLGGEPEGMQRMSGYRSIQERDGCSGVALALHGGKRETGSNW